MQTEVPTLPVVHFNTHKNLNRKQNSNLGRTSVETKANSPNKNVACLSSKKKSLHPLLGRPYQSNIRHCPPSEQSTKPNKNSIEQRVLSAKMLRIKELQNQLADAHYRLNELANENKLLKSLQKRQDSALKHYEGRNAELPRIINSHHEELRVLQIKYKKIKALQKETGDLLKEKETELQQLQSQNKHLLQLSKDRNLEEREKLQLQVSDLNHRIQQQQDTIQTLHRKLTLETKSLKQQLNLEISKRKEKQKHLDEATEKLRTLEKFLDNRERRLYYNGQLLFPDKSRRFGTQSLTNLRDISSTSNPLKLADKNKKWQTTDESSLPALRTVTSDSNDKSSKADERVNSNQALDRLKTETMANLDQIRKYRLQKSPNRKLSDDPEEKSEELDFKVNENSKSPMTLKSAARLEEQEEKYEMTINKFRRMYQNRRAENFNKQPKNELLAYSSGGSESENEISKDSYTNAISNSKQLHSRLISSADDTSDSKELTFSNCKYTDKLKVLVRERTNSYESDSEMESEMNKQSIKHYLTINHRNDKLHVDASAYDNRAAYNSTKEARKSTPPKMLYQKNLLDEMHAETKTIENENAYEAPYDTKAVETEYKESESLTNYAFDEAAPEDRQYNIVNIANEKSVDTIKPEISQSTEVSFNSDSPSKSTKDFLDSAKNSDEDTRSTLEATEIGIVSKNIFLENYNLETRNKLNKQELDRESVKADAAPTRNVQFSDNDAVHDILTDVNARNETIAKKKVTNYSKEKLLASMKAIDDNENIEYLNQDYGKRNAASRRQATENVFHAKKKQDIIKDIFDVDVIKNENADGYNKLH